MSTGAPSRLPRGTRAFVEGIRRSRRKSAFLVVLALVGSASAKSGGAALVFRDPRDGRSCRAVRIGAQVWMAGNLGFPSDSSWCGGDDARSCRRPGTGRVYTQEAARSACPPGWHLPTEEEWRTLESAAGGDSLAGRALKSRRGWRIRTRGDQPPGNGTDAFGFGALPLGRLEYDGGGGWDGPHHLARFWTADSGLAVGFEACSDHLRFLHLRGDEGMAYHVRCTQDVPTRELRAKTP